MNGALRARPMHGAAPWPRTGRGALVAAAWLALSLLGARSARAQVVRGTVTNATSGAPVAGALVELVTADSVEGRIATALSDPSGSFALRAPGAGRYRLLAKRIGVRRYASEPFALAAGETRTLDITLDQVEYRLPTVMVTANAVCSVVPGERDRVAALWEEARTALDAAEISLRDKLFTAQVTRYVRELDATSLRVLRETRSEVRGVVASPFSALPAESLSVVGYWRPAEGGGAYYYGPDARVLLSDAFLGDHCFRPVSGKGSRAGMVGLAFTPVADRPVPEVVGTVWMDARTFELRLVEFGYDRVREGVDIKRVGGEVHFARLANGAWIVRRWHLRVPLLGRPLNPVATEGSSPWILVRPTMLGLSEEGGEVTTDEMRPTARPASIAGVVRDSSGRRPLAGATVRIGGTAREVTADADGRFAFDSVVAGAVTLVVNAPGYDAFGIVAADQAFELAAGEARRVTLTAHDARAIAPRLCQGRGVPYGRGTVHLTVRDSASGAPIAGLAATAHWMSTVGRVTGDSVPVLIEARSDERGMIAFCEMPADRPITVRVAHPRGGTTEPMRLVIRGREVRHVDVVIGAGPPDA